MSFIKYVEKAQVILEHKEPGESNEISPLVEAKGDFDSILKVNNIKIKSKIQTDFGTQFEFFKKQDQTFIDNLFPENDVMQKNNFIFVVL